MEAYAKALLTLLKNQFEQTIQKMPPEWYQRTFGKAAPVYREHISELQAYWLERPEQNLIYPMDANAYSAYEAGAGKEISSGKIGAMKSSSALTYNLFWDQIAEIVQEDEEQRLGSGTYKVELEKKFHTLKSSSFPAHLDAFLYCKHTKEAIACEMKMTEWIFNKPGQLAASYLNPENYIDPDAGKVFSGLAREIIPYEIAITEQKQYPCVLPRYDAFQMFKHIVACYTACAKEEPREIKKLTLVNCAWTLRDPSVLKDELYFRYIEEERAEKDQFAHFKRAMVTTRKVFAKLGVDFDICFYTFSELLAMLRKTPEELQYLERYII